MSEFVIKHASRQGIVPLIALYSESGCGKTYSSLLAARGLAGPTGKIIMVDTEGGRGELYSDLPEIGGYDVIRFDAPFTPARYVEAVEAVQKAGAAVGILDSGSHEWEGVEGVLDMAAANEQRSGKAGLHNWKSPKFEHAKFVLALTRSTIPWIVCLRAKYKSRQTKDHGKTVIVKDDHTSPIQAEDFIFEATCHAEIMPDHSLRLTKWSHPGLKTCFPANGPITIQTGELIAKWCASPGGKPIAPQAAESPKSAPAQSIGQLKNKLWTLTMKIHNGDTGKLESWLREGLIISEMDKISALPMEAFPEIIAKSEIRMKEMNS